MGKLVCIIEHTAAGQMPDGKTPIPKGTLRFCNPGAPCRTIQVSPAKTIEVSPEIKIKIADGAPGEPDRFYTESAKFEHIPAVCRTETQAERDARFKATISKVAGTDGSWGPVVLHFVDESQRTAKANELRAKYA